MSEEILLSVNPARIVVDPGGTADVALQIQNRSAVVDDFDVEVLGDAASWATVDRPRVPIFPGGSESVHVSLRPPRAPRPEAGTMAVGFRVRSVVDPAKSAVEECGVELKPFTEIAGEISPRTSRGRFSASHQLRVTNKGNAPVSVAVRADVQQGDCQVLLPEGPLQVAAGERKTTRVRVRPAGARWGGGEEVHQYRLSLEPQGGTPVALDAAMRQRQILHVPVVLLLTVALLLVGAYAAYGKGANPIQTAMRWTGSVYNQPSPAPPAPQTAAPATGQPAPATNQPANPVVSVPASSPSPSQSPSASAAPTPSQHAIQSPLGLPTGVPIARTTLPPIYALCVTLISATLTDSAAGMGGGRVHTLTWTSNGTCNPFSGSISATYVGYLICVYPCVSHPVSFTKTYPISGSSGTYADAIVTTLYTGVSYKLTLTDGRGATVTAMAT